MFYFILFIRFDQSLANPALITQVRHRQHLEQCLESLNAFLGIKKTTTHKQTMLTFFLYVST